MKSVVLWIVLPCIVEAAQNFRRTYCLLQGWRVRQSRNQLAAFLCLYLAYLSTLKMEVICSSKLLICLQTTRCYNPEDFAVHSHCYENLHSKLLCHFTKENGVILVIGIEHSLKIDKGCWKVAWRSSDKNGQLEVLAASLIQNMHFAHVCLQRVTEPVEQWWATILHKGQVKKKKTQNPSGCKPDGYSERSIFSTKYYIKFTWQYY